MQPPQKAIYLSGSREDLGFKRLLAIRLEMFRGFCKPEGLGPGGLHSEEIAREFHVELLRGESRIASVR